MSKIKDFFIRMILFFNLDEEIKEKIIKEGYGTPIKMIEKEVRNSCICPDYAPEEYFSKDVIYEKKTYLTNTDRKIIVEENFIGLNFEAPCDKYELKIYELK